MTCRCEYGRTVKFGTGYNAIQDATAVWPIGMVRYRY
jgi:hypothetical protein